MNTANSNQSAKKIKYSTGAYNSSKKMKRYEDGIETSGKKSKKMKAGRGGSSMGSNKVWMAALAGASAGIIAGLLMAPNSGRDTIDSLKKSALRLGDQLDETFKVYLAKLEDMALTRPGDSLQISGNLDNIKGKMKAQYGDLTDNDLAYIEGKEDEFLGNLQTRLGKSKRELVSWINSLV